MASTMLGYLVVAAGLVALYRLLTSASGSVQIPGLKATWGK